MNRSSSKFSWYHSQFVSAFIANQSIYSLRRKIWYTLRNTDSIVILKRNWNFTDLKSSNESRRTKNPRSFGVGGRGDFQCLGELGASGRARMMKIGRCVTDLHKLT